MIFWDESKIIFIKKFKKINKVHFVRWTVTVK